MLQNVCFCIKTETYFCKNIKSKGERRKDKGEGQRAKGEWQKAKGEGQL